MVGACGQRDGIVGSRGGPARPSTRVMQPGPSHHWNRILAIRAQQTELQGEEKKARGTCDLWIR